MSADDDPDYFPTPSQLADGKSSDNFDSSDSFQSSDDLDSDIDILFEETDHFANGNFDVGIEDLIPPTRTRSSDSARTQSNSVDTPRTTRTRSSDSARTQSNSVDTPRTTRTRSAESAHNRSCRLLDEADVDPLPFAQGLGGQFSISNILYRSDPATPGSSKTTPRTDLDRELEKTVTGYLSNTDPENTLKKNQTALNAFADFAKGDSTVQTRWEVMPLSRMPNALVRYVATKGRDYDQVTFHGLLGG